MEDQLRSDLKRSHALLNSLTAVTQGAYAFECALGQFGVDGAGDHADQIARQIHELESWWSGFKRREPLLRADTPPSRSARHAWAMLRAARQRLRTLEGELSQPLRLASLGADPSPLRLRAGAACDSAYASEHYMRGLICRGEVMGEPQVIARCRKWLPAAEQRVREAHRILERAYRRLDASSGPGPEIAELLDATLTVPVEIALRALSLDHLACLETGNFGFADAGIDAEQRAAWQKLGLTPLAAGRWAAAGFTPVQAQERLGAGMQSPLVAAEFHWRGIDSAAAGAWFAAGIDGRTAAAWIDARVGVQEASALMANGIRHPEQRHRIA